MLRMYRDLSFTALGGDSPALRALGYVILLADQFRRAIEQVIKHQVFAAGSTTVKCGVQELYRF